MRCITLLSAIVCLACSVLPMVVICTLILICDGPPVFFCQTRIGQGMHPFRLYKFRTMHSSFKCNRPVTVGKDPRITPLGQLLRKYHLDELPQLFNILLGDMNFIGPRPEVPEFVSWNNSLQREISRVRPGLFDSAALHWLSEAEVLNSVPDWREYYCNKVLPDKCARSLADIRSRSFTNDIRLLLDALVLVCGRGGHYGGSANAASKPTD